MNTTMEDVIRLYRNGALSEAAAANLRDLVEAVQLTRKGGKITLTLSVSPEQGSLNGVDVTADLKVTLPKPPLPKATFFVDGDYGLSRTDPGQREMFKEHVDGETGVVTERPVFRDVTGGR